MKSRSFTIVDVPEPRKVEAKFVYNFFTSDERINSTGDPRVRGIANKNLQKMINAGSLNLEVPRYVEVSFDEVHIDAGNYGDAASQILFDKSILSKIDSEETITNVGFAALRETDDRSTLRIKQKFEALSKALGIEFTDSEQTKKIASTLGVSQSRIQEILSPLKDPSLLLVNAKKIPNNDSSVFQMASMAKIHSQINKRLMSAVLHGADDTSPLSKNSVISQAKSISEKFVSEADQFLLSDLDVEPAFQPLNQPIETTDPKKILGASVIGYVVIRHQYGDEGELIGSRAFVLPGRSNNKYIDSEILYGTSYSYEIRAIVKVDAVVEGSILFDEGQDLENKTNWRIDFLVSSRPSCSIRVRTEEFQAPNEPDGLFYRFNYEIYCNN